MRDGLQNFVIFANKVHAEASRDGYALLRFSVDDDPNQQPVVTVALPVVLASELAEHLGEVIDIAAVSVKT